MVCYLFIILTVPIIKYKPYQLRFSLSVHLEIDIGDHIILVFDQHIWSVVLRNEIREAKLNFNCVARGGGGGTRLVKHSKDVHHCILPRSIVHQKNLVN